MWPKDEGRRTKGEHGNGSLRTPGNDGLVTGQSRISLSLSFSLFIFLSLSCFIIFSLYLGTPCSTSTTTSWGPRVRGGAVHQRQLVTPLGIGHKFHSVMWQLSSLSHTLFFFLSLVITLAVEDSVQRVSRYLSLKMKKEKKTFYPLVKFDTERVNNCN